MRVPDFFLDEIALVPERLEESNFSKARYSAVFSLPGFFLPPPAPVHYTILIGEGPLSPSVSPSRRSFF